MPVRRAARARAAVAAPHRPTRAIGHCSRNFFFWAPVYNARTRTACPRPPASDGDPEA